MYKWKEKKKDDLCVTVFFFNYKFVLERLSYLFLFNLGEANFFSDVIGEQLKFGGGGESHFSLAPP